MNEDQLRDLVRESIARHLAGRAPHARVLHPTPLMVDRRLQASHAIYDIPRDNSDGDDGPCVIEPAVACNHCNYCKSHGH